jgi:hypothetical protein
MLLCYVMLCHVMLCYVMLCYYVMLCCNGQAREHSLVWYTSCRLSSVQQEVFTHRHDRHQTSVNKAVARVVEVRWLMKKL